MPAVPSSEFLTQKAGVLPVWGWGAIGLGAAYAYSRYKAKQSAAQGNGTTATTDAAGESTAAAPQFIIENNEPSGGWGSVSVPVTVNNPAPVPVTTPPGTTTTPPTTTPPVYQGGKPPGGTGGPIPVSGPTAPAKPAPTKPAAKPPIAYKVQHGDNLSTIAAKYHTTAAALFSYNTSASSPHSASARATLLKQGPNLIYAGQTIYIPQ